MIFCYFSPFTIISEEEYYVRVLHVWFELRYQAYSFIYQKVRHFIPPFADWAKPHMGSWVKCTGVTMMSGMMTSNTCSYNLHMSSCGVWDWIPAFEFSGELLPEPFDFGLTDPKKLSWYSMIQYMCSYGATWTKLPFCLGSTNTLRAFSSQGRGHGLVSKPQGLYSDSFGLLVIDFTSYLPLPPVSNRVKDISCAILDSSNYGFRFEWARKKTRTFSGLAFFLKIGHFYYHPASYSQVWNVCSITQRSIYQTSPSLW